MNAQKATKIRAELVQNIKEGVSPQSLREKRELEELLRIEEEKNKKLETLNNYTFGDLAKEYIEWSENNKKSWKNDKQRYSLHLAPTLSHLKLNEVSPLLLEKLKRSLLDKRVTKNGKELTSSLSPATVKHCLVLVRQIYNKAIEWNLYHGKNPIKNVKLPKLNNKRIGSLTRDEADLLLSELIKHSQQVHDQSLLALYCGLRFGEISRLRFSDIDLSNNTIRIVESKGDQENSQFVFMPERVQEMVTSYRSDKPNELIFPDSKGNRQTSVSNTFNRAVETVGLNNDRLDRYDKIVFHSLRHTFGTWLASQGTPLVIIKELMRHKSIEMTLRYAHAEKDQMRKAINQLAKDHNVRNEGTISIEHRG